MGRSALGDNFAGFFIFPNNGFGNFPLEQTAAHTAKREKGGKGLRCPQPF